MTKESPHYFPRPRNTTIYKMLNKVLPEKNLSIFLFRQLEHPTKAAVYHPLYGLVEPPPPNPFSHRMDLQDALTPTRFGKVDGLLVLFDMRSLDWDQRKTDWDNIHAPGLIRSANAAFYICQKKDMFPTLYNGEHKLYFGVMYTKKIYVDLHFSEAMRNIVQSLHERPV